MVLVEGVFHGETVHPCSDTDIDEKAPESKSARFWLFRASAKRPSRTAFNTRPSRLSQSRPFKGVP